MKNTQNCQKIELYGIPTTKDLKKLYSSRQVGGAETRSQGGEDERGSGEAVAVVVATSGTSSPIFMCSGQKMGRGRGIPCEQVIPAPGQTVRTRVAAPGKIKPHNFWL